MYVLIQCFVNLALSSFSWCVDADALGCYLFHKWETTW